MNFEKTTPFSIKCDSCGSPMKFDILKQNYACLSCGNSDFIDSKKENLKDWIESKKQELDKDTDKLTIYSCANCGADITSKEDSQTMICGFCGATSVKNNFLNTDNYPLAILPFKLTHDEACELLKDYLDKFKILKHSKKIDASTKLAIENLRGIYLPYQLFQGPIEAVALRDNTENVKKFVLNSYVNNKLISAANNLPNELLDNIEPFEMNSLVQFEFIYLGNQQAKTQDIDYDNLTTNLQVEAINDIENLISRKLGTQYINIDIDYKNLTSIPILAPIYYVNIENFSIAINGQNGQISSIDINKKKKSIPWIIEPIAITTTVSLIFGFIISYSSFLDLDKIGIINYLKELVKNILTVAIFPAIVSLMGYSRTRKLIITKNILKTSSQKYARDENGELKIKDSKDEKNDISEPIFIDEYDGAISPVDLKVYTLNRIIGILLFAFTFNFLPIIIPFFMLIYKVHNFFNLFTLISNLMWGSVVWLMITIPVSIVLYIQIIRFTMYDDVFVRPYGSNKPFKRTFGKDFKIFDYVKDIKEYAILIYVMSKFLFFILLFSFVGSSINSYYTALEALIK